ncbi:quinol monooxygenase [Geomonas silvestris]|uniref:Quinol monooxygenase n=1 Tax=Geomonas silvestris TaxID=2740184 RepID=A0A6V8MF37_9BACT|nr:putative quinol monooxygenase [Geomonas silvestris]GFO58542.1 quinol monooxygenase [Geomonas silvestris]
MISVIASIRLNEGARESFLQIFNANVPAVRREDGCLEYYPAVDVDSGIPVQRLDADIVTILEKWQSLEALRAHLAAPHMLAYKEKVAPLVKETVLKVLTSAEG